MGYAPGCPQGGGDLDNRNLPTFAHERESSTCERFLPRTARAAKSAVARTGFCYAYTFWDGGLTVRARRFVKITLARSRPACSGVQGSHIDPREASCSSSGNSGGPASSGFPWIAGSCAIAAPPSARAAPTDDVSCGSCKSSRRVIDASERAVDDGRAVLSAGRKVLAVSTLAFALALLSPLRGEAHRGDRVEELVRVLLHNGSYK